MEYFYIYLPALFEYITGGGILASPKFLCRGYFVLLNKCKTIHIKPARTAIPVVTPNSVGKFEVITAISV